MLEFWKNEWKLFLEDIDSVKNVFAKLFGRKQDYLILKSGTQQAAGEVLPQEEPVQASSISLENVSSEVTLDAEDGIKAGSAFAQENGVFADLASQGSEIAQATQPTYQLDGIDHKVTAYFGENIDE